ncbi:unnamed protein product [Heterobilharzia americana]|nr:unnamed protein product [Heterobilharzia americana]
MQSNEVYTKEMIEIIHFYGELNETDSICFIEQRATHINSMHNSESINNIPKLLINNKPIIHCPYNLKMFNKIILYDCVNLIRKKKEFFQNTLYYLDKMEGKLLIIKKLEKWKTTFDEKQSEQFQNEWKSTFSALLNAGFNIEWDVIDIPVNVNYRLWLQSMNNDSEYLIRNMNASLKYIPLNNERIRLNEQLLIIIASPKLQTDCKANSIKRSVHSLRKQNCNRNVYRSTPHIQLLTLTPELEIY